VENKGHLALMLCRLHTLLMAQHRSAEEFLALRRTLTESPNTALVDELDEDLRPLIEANPDQGEVILRALAGSADADDRDTAAIYVQYLFRTRPAAAQDIWIKLARDPDRAVRDQARECASEILPELLFSSDAQMQRHALATIDAIATPY
jgi:hypothetical protein